MRWPKTAACVIVDPFLAIGKLRFYHSLGTYRVYQPQWSTFFAFPQMYIIIMSNYTILDDDPMKFVINQNMPYGHMPPSMLASRYEETILDPAYEEQAYYNFARNTLCDRRPDDCLFEEEQRRGAVNRSSGKLQLLQNGHRGDVYGPEQPELFLGFGGPEDVDVRGVAIDPDMKLLASHQWARNRYQNFDADDSAFETSGGRSEAKVRDDNMANRVQMKKHWAVFDDSIDGRREGMRRQYDPYGNSIHNLVTTGADTYGELIQSLALAPSRRILHNRPTIYREEGDQDCKFADYTSICKTGNGMRKVTGVNRESQRDTNLPDPEYMARTQRVEKKTAAQLMKVSANTPQSANEQIFARSNESRIARQLLADAMKSMMCNVRDDGDYAYSVDARPGTRGTLAAPTHGRGLTTEQHDIMTYNTFIMQSAIHDKMDPRKALAKMAHDADVFDSMMTADPGHFAQFIAESKLRQYDDDIDKQEQIKTVDYSRLRGNPDASRLTRLQANESDLMYSQRTQHRRPADTRVPVNSGKKSDAGDLGGFFGNVTAERHGGKLGTRYMMGKSDHALDVSQHPNTSA